jgi:hypothetical protein
MIKRMMWMWIGMDRRDGLGCGKVGGLVGRQREGLERYYRKWGNGNGERGGRINWK